jgi:hypothetical protein
VHIENLLRAPRAEEIFYVHDRASLSQLVQSFLASRRVDP